MYEVVPSWLQIISCSLQLSATQHKPAYKYPPMIVPGRFFSPKRAFFSLTGTCPSVFSIIDLHFLNLCCTSICSIVIYFSTILKNLFILFLLCPACPPFISQSQKCQFLFVSLFLKYTVNLISRRFFSHLQRIAYMVQVSIFYTQTDNRWVISGHYQAAPFTFP